MCVHVCVYFVLCCLIEINTLIGAHANQTQPSDKTHPLSPSNANTPQRAEDRAVGRIPWSCSTVPVATTLHGRSCPTPLNQCSLPVADIRQRPSSSSRA